LAALGLMLEPFGPGAVLVRETPAMLGETDFWLKDVGIDGFRLDAIRHLIEDAARSVH
jgi:hypothetical protein